ncbi:hypothetical protein PTTG_01534 [Puccinia triticina 1-1 BBBD Race 1]|uniref:Uncharacterized protein n=1 Tax=Puccinia triticina (isolate 1-1 / race 1 (BBBD)) TaxID=630390 RepID=A0A0C4ELA0_PUCT1|nr:hypothetical protein PTTG_01534 [Puccinia triticina 1-1 BBBD Race 1]
MPNTDMIGSPVSPETYTQAPPCPVGSIASNQVYQSLPGHGAPFKTSIPPGGDSQRSLKAPNHQPVEVDSGSESNDIVAVSKRARPSTATTSQPQTSTASQTQPTDATTSKAKKRRRDIVDSDQPSSAMNFRQDSDEENAKAKKRPRKIRARRDSEFGIDDIELYFLPPVFAEGQSAENGDQPMHYECKWCGCMYKKGEGTRANLVKHRDGAPHRAPCHARADAIRAGAKLPLTAKEVAAKKKAQETGSIMKYTQLGKFDVKIFNQLIVMWLIRNSLPWSRIEDFYLGVAFNYLLPGIKLYS